MTEIRSIHPKGLLISPATDFTTTSAGKPESGSVTIGNHTTTPLAINLSVKQFSVDSYTYNYNFSQSANQWVRLSRTSAMLAPGETQSIPYTINVPGDASAGGYYYTFFASANIASGAIHSTVQAGSLLYLTVNGDLTRSAKLDGDSIQRVVFGKQVDYHYNLTDTGNVYFFVYVAGKLQGPTTGPSQTSVAHIIMPGKVRIFSGAIQSPVLPGIYRATYGYKTDAGDSIQKSHLILYIPPWFVALILIILLALNLWIAKRRKTTD